MGEFRTIEEYFYNKENILRKVNHYSKLNNEKQLDAITTIYTNEFGLPIQITQEIIDYSFETLIIEYSSF